MASNTTLSCGALAAWTLAAVALQICGVALFVFGFFPVKPALPGVSGLESYREPTCNDTAAADGRDFPPQQLRSLYEALSEISPKYDRLIMMVIDGLPADFVLGRGNMPPTKELMDAMPYTQYLLSNKNAIGYHAKAAPPTVTMPRLKAIVSGAIGDFLDVAFNFNTQAFLDDNLLGQFFHVGWRMVMHGDETWIKLFPRFFTRQDGVSSFYVKDTVEVDYNVSRHLDAELAAHDWDLMILHYLGLDHVGHIGGRQSVLMIPKLKEMDKVIEKIYTSAVRNGKEDAKRTLLLVASDHGMTNGGNHGGSSYEETDSLAIFVDLGDQMLDHTFVLHRPAFQVDIAPTLALLLGVPIPKNSIGVLLMEMLEFLTDEQQLRALELNSWQLLRLLHSQIPGLLCGHNFCTEFQDQTSKFGKFKGDIVEMCLSYSKAADFHVAWKDPGASGTITNSTKSFTNTVEAYYEFLGTASKWLSNRATDKPVSLLFAGSLMIVSSSFTMLKLLLDILKSVELVKKKTLTQEKCSYLPLNLDEACIVLGSLLHLVSLGSSSMVEEEQYTCHFLTSTLYLIFAFMKIQTFLTSELRRQLCVAKGVRQRKLSHSVCSLFLSGRSHFYLDISLVLVVLICGRILRGWHQGGVNWVHLPDISKYLERSGSSTIKNLQIASVFFVMFFSPCTIYFLESVKPSVRMVLICHFLSGLLILLYIIKPLCTGMMDATLGDNIIPQMLYVLLLVTTFSALASPWLAKIHFKEGCPPDGSDSGHMFLICIRDCICLIGGSFTAMWCLLQLLLQSPRDAMPILLLLLQILANMIYFMSDNGSLHQQWVKVAAMYFLGMAGHFGLGNSNSIATIDVAGAFTGLSTHSTTLAGILMFAITYASPLLFQISGIMCLSTDSLVFSLSPHKSELSHGLLRAIGLSCLVPLVLNSISLTAFTIILLVMRNHLFVWSVFSPKYLYVCAATAGVYIGVLISSVAVTYVSLVLVYRKAREPSLCQHYSVSDIFRLNT